jgi:hypothetical protein
LNAKPRGRIKNGWKGKGGQRLKEVSPLRLELPEKEKPLCPN